MHLIDEESLKTRVLNCPWQAQDISKKKVRARIGPFYRIAKEYSFVSKSLTIVEEVFEGRLGSRLKLFWIQ